MQIWITDTLKKKYNTTTATHTKILKTLKFKTFVPSGEVRPIQSHIMTIKYLKRKRVACIILFPTVFKITLFLLLDFYTCLLGQFFSILFHWKKINKWKVIFRCDWSKLKRINYVNIIIERVQQSKIYHASLR